MYWQDSANKLQLTNTIMNTFRSIYPLKSFDFFLNRIGLELETSKGLNELHKNEEHKFNLDFFLKGITNGEYIYAIYSAIQYFTSNTYTKDLNIVEKAIFYNLVEGALSVFRDLLADWEFPKPDAIDCWKLYAVCARNQNLPLWTDLKNNAVRKPYLTSLTNDDWNYIFDTIKNNFFENVDWLYFNNYREIDEKAIIPTDEEYEEALSWLFEAYAKTWQNNTKLLQKLEQKKNSNNHRMKRREHDFFNFMKTIKESIAREYERIRLRSSEDPGTAGDQAEENWAEFLRNWLPANYPIVTKGRVINEDGVTSPQVDILVLNPSYPKQLRNKKHYFLGGVIAVFECKLTLKKEHLRKFFENSFIIKRLSERRKGNPYDELHQLPIYGLLAHSHIWKKTKNKNVSMLNRISEFVYKFCQHPSDMPDIICIADTATYVSHKSVCVGPFADIDCKELFKELDKDGGITAEYIEYGTNIPYPKDFSGEILGMLICRIIHMMAYEDKSLRLYSNYLYNLTSWSGIGSSILWKRTNLSRNVGERLIKKGFSKDPWSKWIKNF